MSRKRVNPIPKIVKIFGSNIKLIRVEKKLTQLDLAVLMNLDPETIRRYEKGIQEPKLSVIVKFSEVLQVSLEEIINYIDNEIDD